MDIITKIGGHDVSVVPIDKKTANLFVLNKHYSKRAPTFLHAFGLVVDGLIDGVVVYGHASRPIAKYAFKERDFRLFELCRLVIQTELRNAASILVGRSLSMLPSPSAVVSYADTEWGHAGVIYQATNWLYTGATVAHDHTYVVDGVKTHPRTLVQRGITDPKRWAKENGVTTLPPCEKHRYFFLNGTKKQKREMLANLTYPIVKTYPKLDKRMYDDGPLLDVTYKGEKA